jgi:uroporphyrinogen decarboxylase
MKHRDRFFATIENAPVDRPACWLGLPGSEAGSNLMQHFGVNSIDAVRKILHDDICPIEVPVNNLFSENNTSVRNQTRIRHFNSPLEKIIPSMDFRMNVNDVADPEMLILPDPSLIVDAELSKRRARAVDDHMARLGVLWSSHFQDACSVFGMERVLLSALVQPDKFKAILDRITKFYLGIGEIFFKATKGFLDAVLIGNDLGSQTGLLVDRALINDYIFPGTKMIIDQAKSYDLKVMYHSCGAIFPVIEDIINLGADIIHPVQTAAYGMELSELKTHFLKKVAFCGGIDTQFLLAKGSPVEVSTKVHELVNMFPTGFIVSPSQDSILPDIPPANIEALFKALNQQR